MNWDRKLGTRKTMSRTLTEAARIEYLVWLKIFSEHMDIIVMLAIPGANIVIDDAVTLKKHLTILHSQVTGGHVDIATVTSTVDKVLTLKKLLILEHLKGGAVSSKADPVLLNHMIDELEHWKSIEEEILRTGDYQGKLPIQLHQLWLGDAEGHADVAMTTLSPVEAEKRKEYKLKKKQFAHLHQKAHELAGMYRAFGAKCPKHNEPISKEQAAVDFPALQQLTQDANLVMKVFINMISELEKQRLNVVTLGTLDPLVAVHFYREAVYYLYQLGRRAGWVEAPKLLLD